MLWLKKVRRFVMAIFVLTGISSVPAWGTDYCITLSGAASSTYVGKAFSLPSAGDCKAWQGVCQNGCSPDNVQTGVACTASDGSQVSFGLTTSYLLGDRQFDWIRLDLPGMAGSGNFNYQNPALGTTDYNARGAACQPRPIVISSDAVMTMAPTALAVYPGGRRVYVGGLSYEADGKNLAVLSLDRHGDIVGPAVFFPETTGPLDANKPTYVSDIVVDAAARRLYVAWSDWGQNTSTSNLLSVYELDAAGDIVSGPTAYSCATGTGESVPCTNMNSLAINRQTNTLYAGTNSAGGMIVVYWLGDNAAGPLTQIGSYPLPSDGYIQQLAVSAAGDKLYAAGSAAGLETFLIDTQPGPQQGLLIGNPPGAVFGMAVQRQATQNPNTRTFYRFSYTPEAIYQRQAIFPSVPTTIPLSAWSLNNEIPVAAGPSVQTLFPPIVDVSASVAALTAAQLYTPTDVFTQTTGVVGANIQIYALGGAGAPVALSPTNSETTVPGQYPLVTASSADGISVVLTSALRGVVNFATVNVTNGYQIFVSMLNMGSQPCPSGFTVSTGSGAISGTFASSSAGACSATQWLSLDPTNALRDAAGQVLFTVDANPAPSPATYQVQIGRQVTNPNGGTGTVQTLATLTDKVSMAGSTNNPVLFLLPGYAYTGNAKAAMETLTGHAQRFESWARAVAVPESFRPHQFTLSGYFLWLGEASTQYYTEAVKAISNLGFNTVGIDPGGLRHPAYMRSPTAC
jgi:hypothetical protein